MWVPMYFLTNCLNEQQCSTWLLKFTLDEVPNCRWVSLKHESPNKYSWKHNYKVYNQDSFELKKKRTRIWIVDIWLR